MSQGNSITNDPLWTLPQPAKNALLPEPMPGFNAASQHALIRWLKENHNAFHCFFNEQRFHNHMAHHLYASYCFGAKDSLLEAIFKSEKGMQRPRGKSPCEITDANWQEHLGKAEFYDGYVTFFAKKLVENGLRKTLETYIFAHDVNFGPNSSPQMLDRLLGGLLHPLIHVGHGAETGILGLAAEGLAQTAVHKAPHAELLSPQFFNDDKEIHQDAELDFADGSRTVFHLAAGESFAVFDGQDVDAFTILQRILDDRSLVHRHRSQDEFNYADGLKTVGPVVQSYCKEWKVTPDNIYHRLEELAWVVTMIYGICGWRDGKEFHADFHWMHLVTSTVFLFSTVQHLSPRAASLLLRGHFHVVVGLWVARGRPAFKIAEFFNRTSSTPVPPIKQPQPYSSLLDPQNVVQDPWMGLLTSVVAHPDEHLIKLERSLAHFARLYGGRPAGFFKRSHLKGAEMLDGTLFVRVAGLSAERLGWVREGQADRGWNFEMLSEHKKYNILSNTDSGLLQYAMTSMHNEN